MKRKIMIIEPSDIIKNGLKALIGSASEFEVVACIDDLMFIDEKMAVNRPDIVIIDPAIIPYSRQLALPQVLDEISTVALLYQYTAPATLRIFDSAIDINDSRESILETLSNIESCSKKEKKGESTELTKREIDVLVLVAKGMMSKEIADKLNISIHTVISHRKNITKKTGIKSVAGLAVYAMLNNLMDES